MNYVNNKIYCSNKKNRDTKSHITELLMVPSRILRKTILTAEDFFALLQRDKMLSYKDWEDSYSRRDTFMKSSSIIRWTMEARVTAMNRESARQNRNLREF